MGRIRWEIMFLVAGVAWMAAFGWGFARLWRYEGAAGAAARGPVDWPAESRIKTETGKARLVVLMHPQCPCSRATVEELARLMARCQGKLSAEVLMIQPA